MLTSWATLEATVVKNIVSWCLELLLATLVSLNPALSTYDPVKSIKGSNLEALSKADKQLGRGPQKEIAFIGEL